MEGRKGNKGITGYEDLEAPPLPRKEGEGNKGLRSYSIALNLVLSLALVFSLSRHSGGAREGRGQRPELTNKPPHHPAVNKESFHFLNSPEGQRLLTDGECLSGPYFEGIGLQFVTQKDQSACGRATTVTIANTIAMHNNWKGEAMIEGIISQQNLETQPCIANLSWIPGGMSMQQVQNYINCFSSHTQIIRGDEFAGVDDLRRVLRETMSTSGKYIALNYDRAQVGQAPEGTWDSGQTFGHWSPIAAYNPGADKALIMDVARYKFPPLWAPVAAIFNAMNTIDPCGYCAEEPDWPEGRPPEEWLSLPRHELYPLWKGWMERNLNCSASYRGLILVDS